jgi:Tol biopolymer transport system component
LDRGGPPEERVPAELVRAELDRILQSRLFLHSERLSRFLRFVVEQTLRGRAEDLKESVLAVEVFDRPPTYDSRVHSVVRVEASRLRQKLQRYYQTEGLASEVCVELRKGSYVALIRRREAATLGPTLVPLSADRRPPQTAPVPALMLARPRLLALLGLILVLVTAAVTWSLVTGRAARAEPALRRLTSDTGLTFQPALSWQAKLLAFASDRAGEGGLDIWVQPLAGGQPVRLTGNQGDDLEPDLSPDGTLVVYRSEGERRGVYLAPVLGGKSTLLVEGGFRPRFSPDGRRIAYWVGERHFRSARIFLVSSAGGKPTPLVPDFLYAAYPVWSPDGRKILFAGNSGRDGEVWDWWVAPADGGPAIKTGAQEVFQKQGLSASDRRWGARGIAPSAWMRDQGVLFSASSGGSTNVWRLRISPESGRASFPAEQLTSGPGREDYLSSASEDRVLVSVLAEKSDIWRLPLYPSTGKPLGRPLRLTTDAADNLTPQASSDGSLLVYLSNRNGNYDIFARRMSSGREEALTDTRQDEYSAVLSADARRMAFGVRLPTKQPIYALAPGAGGRSVICEDCGQPRSWSSDGKSLLFQHGNPGDSRIGLVSSAGQTRELISSPGESFYSPQFSPDNRWIAVVSRSPPDLHRILVVPFRNGAVPRRQEWITIVEAGQWVDKPRWSPSGEFLYYVSDRDGPVCIWAQRVGLTDKQPQGEPFPVWHCHSRRYSLDNLRGLELAVTRDSLFFSLDESTGNIWMLTRHRWE